MEDDADNFASPDSDALAPADANLQEEGEDDEAASDEPETLGEAPEDVSQVFMRTSTVLLSPGEGQYEWGMIYGWQDTAFAVVLTSGVLAVEQVRERSWIVPLSMRYGVTPGTEFFAQLPVGAAAFERSNIQEDTRSSRFGIGDFTTGFKHVFREEKGEHPDVIGSMSVTAPTGSHPFKGDDVASLGDGFWGVGAALTVVKSYEPVVLFASGGYSHEFSREFSGTRIQPGEAFDYSFGMGMAINDRLVASAETLGAVRTFIYADDRRIPDSLQEPLSLRLGLTRIDSENRFIEPFLSFGLNRDAQDFQFGILWTGGF